MRTDEKNHSGQVGSPVRPANQEPRVNRVEPCCAPRPSLPQEPGGRHDVGLEDSAHFNPPCWSSTAIRDTTIVTLQSLSANSG